MFSKTKSLAVLAATTLVVAGCSRNSPDTMQSPPPAANFAPTMAAITGRTIDQDTVAGPIEINIADRESDASLLTVSAVTDGTTVVPADGVTLGGTGAVRTITLTPLEAATGTVNVMLTVTDPQGAIAKRGFQFTVNARAASVRDTTLTTFAKGEADAPTAVNGLTFTQDADDPAIFEPLLGE
jgi:hypothetical protein